MPIQPFIARPISFDEANPFVTGLKKGSDIASEFMDNLQKSIALKYADQNQQAALAEAQAKAPYMQAQTQGILQGQIPYQQAQVREIDQGQIPLQQAQSGYYGAETGKINAMLPADIAEANLKLKYPGLSLTGPAAQVAAAQYYDDIQRNASKQNDIANAAAAIRAANLASSPNTNMSLANTPPALSNISRVLGAQNTPGLNLPQTPQQTAVLDNIFGQQPSQQAPIPQQSQPQPQVQAQQPNQSQSYGDMIRNSLFADLASKQARTNYFNNPIVQMGRALNSPTMESLASTNPTVAKYLASALTAGIPGSGQSALTENDYKQLQANLADTLNRKTTTAQIINQRQYAGILDNLFDKGDSLIPDVSKYAGLVGQGQKGIDALKSSFGTSSPEYSNYLLFSRSLAPILSNEMRRTLGGQATDSEQKIMANLANPAWIDSNPVQAMQQYSFLKSVYRSSVNPALAARSSETLSNLKGTDIRPGSLTGNITMISPSGKVGTIPANRADEAIKQGFRRL